MYCIVKRQGENEKVVPVLNALNIRVKYPEHEYQIYAYRETRQVCTLPTSFTVHLALKHINNNQWMEFI